MSQSMNQSMSQSVSQSMSQSSIIALTSTLQKKLSGHPNIIQFISAASIGKEESDHGQSEFLILTELCTGESPALRRESPFKFPGKNCLL